MFFSGDFYSFNISILYMWSRKISGALNSSGWLLRFRALRKDRLKKKEEGSHWNKTEVIWCKKNKKKNNPTTSFIKLQTTRHLLNDTTKSNQFCVTSYTVTSYFEMASNGWGFMILPDGTFVFNNTSFDSSEIFPK